METIKDNKDPPEVYWENYDDENDLNQSETNFYSRRLVNGINMKDLCDGKEILFETSKSFENNAESDEEICDDVIYCDPKSLREKRGAPLNCSFKEILNKMKNVTEDGFVKKMIVSSGIGKVVPNYAYVTVHYNLYKESCELPFDSTYLRNHPENFRLDQGEALMGLEIAVKSMKKNENSVFFIKWELAFGALGCPDRIEGKCDIVADIALMNFVELHTEGKPPSEVDINNIDFTHNINQVKKLLCIGSDEFLKVDAKAAVISYRKALKILNNIRLANEEQENVMLKLKVKCLVNMAVCYNKLGRHEQACLACQDALSIDCNSIKANFHYGRASIALSNFGLARRCLLRANKLKPNDKDINAEIKKLNDKKALYEMRDKIFWKKALTSDKETDNQKQEKSPLEVFEKELLAGLKECLEEEKPFVLSRPLQEEEKNISKRIAGEMNVDFEMHPHFSLFKAKNDDLEKKK